MAAKPTRPTPTPDPMAPDQRGAAALILRYRTEDGGRLSSHAAWRLPRSHPDMPLVDRMHERAQLNDRQHQNASALLHLWHAAGLLPSGVANYGPQTARGHDSDDEDRMTARDEANAVLWAMPDQPMSLVVAMLRGQHPGVRWLATVQATLDRLDHIAARWDGRMWEADRE